MRHPILIGYTRPLTAGEDLVADIAELREAGAEMLIEEPTRSGQALATWMAEAVQGDTLLVTDLSRLGKALADVIRTVLTLREHGVRVHSLNTPQFDAQSPDVIAALAALKTIDRGYRSRQTREGLAGKAVGRPPVLDEQSIAIAAELRRAGRTYPHIAHVLGVSTATVQRTLTQTALVNRPPHPAASASTRPTFSLRPRPAG